MADPVLLDAGAWSTCAAVQRYVRCWGGGAFNTPQVPGIPVTSPITSLSVGTSIACVIVDGRVYCWGRSSGAAAVATQVNGVADAVQVSAGSDFVCARLASGAVRCWGANYHGGLGDGTTTARTDPVAVIGVGDATDISAGDEHACAVRRDGTVWCWGTNRFGVLGDGATDTTVRPVPQQAGTVLTPVAGAVKVEAGLQSTCAIRSDGAVLCWGYNGGALLGGSTSSGHPIVTVRGLSNIATLGVGLGNQCAAVDEGTPYCWGTNELGQLGDGTTVPRGVPPKPVVGLEYVTTLAVGWKHACALADAGVWCWGSKNNIDDAGAITSSLVPKKIPGSSGWLDARVPTTGPITEISTTHDLRCGRDPKVSSRPPLLSNFSCGTWMSAGGSLYGPEPDQMQPVWPRDVTPWAPISQHVSGDGTAAKPHLITTTVTNGRVVLVQRDRYIDGADRSTTEIEIVNQSPLDQSGRLYAAGDCIHADETSGLSTTQGYGWRSGGDVLVGGTGCTDRWYSGRTLSWRPVGLGPDWSTNTPEALSTQISAGGPFDNACVCARRFDDAAGLSWAFTLAPGAKKVVQYDLVVGVGDAEPSVPDVPEVPTDGQGTPLPWNLASIGVAGAHADGITGKSQTIAMIDTGVDVWDPWLTNAPLSDWRDRGVGAPFDTNVTSEFCRSEHLADRFHVLGTCVQSSKDVWPVFFNGRLLMTGYWQHISDTGDGAGSADPYGVDCTSAFDVRLCESSPLIEHAFSDTVSPSWGRNLLGGDAIARSFYDGTAAAAIAGGEEGRSVAPDVKIIAANVAAYRHTSRSPVVANPADMAAALAKIRKGSRRPAAVQLMLPGVLYKADRTAYTGTCTGKHRGLEKRDQAGHERRHLDRRAGGRCRQQEAASLACLPAFSDQCRGREPGGLPGGEFQLQQHPHGARSGGRRERPAAHQGRGWRELPRHQLLHDQDRGGACHGGDCAVQAEIPEGAPRQVKYALDQLSDVRPRSHAELKRPRCCGSVNSSTPGPLADHVRPTMPGSDRSHASGLQRASALVALLVIAGTCRGRSRPGRGEVRLRHAGVGGLGGRLHRPGAVGRDYRHGCGCRPPLAPRPGRCGSLLLAARRLCGDLAPTCPGADAGSLVAGPMEGPGAAMPPSSRKGASHGTSVAGIAAGANVFADGSFGNRGIAPDAEIVAVNAGLDQRGGDLEDLVKCSAMPGDVAGLGERPPRRVQRRRGEPQPGGRWHR